MRRQWGVMDRQWKGQRKDGEKALDGQEKTVDKAVDKTVDKAVDKAVGRPWTRQWTRP